MTWILVVVTALIVGLVAYSIGKGRGQQHAAGAGGMTMANPGKAMSKENPDSGQGQGGRRGGCCG